jgi:hypothetical protein
VTPEDNPDTVTGEKAFEVDPSPTWPFPLKPQHFAEPDATAHADCPPPSPVTPDDNPATETGESDEIFVPSPKVPTPL